MLDFSGQVAIVTGAGRSLGRSYAKELARRGAAVIVNDIGRTGARAWADDVVAEITTAGGKAVASSYDVATPEGGAGLTELALDHFGTVDIVINNAGFLRPAAFEDIDAGRLSEIVSVHLLAAFHVTQPAWRIMKDKGYGRILFTASGSSFGQHSNSHYAAAKEGLLALTRSLHLEARGTDIRVNALMPYAVSEMARENPILSPDLEATRAVQKRLEPRRIQDTVTPLAVLLSSRACPAGGNAYSVLAGRYSRVFLGLAEGWISPGADGVSAETLLAHFEQIDDCSRFIIPRSILDELEFTAGKLGM